LRLVLLSGPLKDEVMRFGLSTAPQRTTWQWLREIWLRADDLEVFESAWTFDHFYPIFGDSSEDCLEGWITLTALLAETERLRGGVLVTGMLYRHPAVLANMASTLDITSGGRLELGVGAGWNEEECIAYGFDLGSLSERFDRFEEGLAVLHGLLTNDRTTFEGEHYQLVDAMNNPKGPQNPLPICIGGSGLKRTLPMAAKYAHHWNYGSPTMSVEDFRMRRDVFLEALAAEGRERSDVTISTLIMADSFDDVAPAAEQWAAEGIDLALVRLPTGADPALLDQLADRLTPLAS
jgi:F420-dependent oxidoreductase-like protein